MMDYLYGSHTVFNIEYHFVWVTKYRYKVLTGDVAIRVRELIQQMCEIFEIRIMGVVSKDHVHLLVSAPPTMAASEIMRRIKGKTSSRLFEEFPSLKKRYWGRHFWTAGQVTEEMIKPTLSTILNPLPMTTLKPNPRRVFDPYPNFQSLCLTHQLLAGGCLVTISEFRALS